MNNTTQNNEILLRGGDSHITENPTSVYTVVDGVVLVYMVPLMEDGEAGRRMLIHEAKRGEIIPSFCRAGMGELWVFCLVALDYATLHEFPGKNSPDVGRAFVERAGLRNIGGEDYADLLLEVYDRNSIKEEGYIFSSQQESQAIREKSLRLIYDLFDRNIRKRKTAESGNSLYDAMAYVCDRSHINIAPIDKIVASAGRRFKLTDVSRVSNFITREVLLEHDWYKKDSDPMVGFLEKGNVPIALIPRGTGGYIAYLPDTHERTKVDAAFEAQLSPKAYALYAPFPNKDLTVFEMFGFGLKQTNPSDWIRFAVMALLGTVIGLLLPMLNEQIYDKFIPMGAGNGIIQICIVLLACNLGNLSFTIVKNLSALRGVTKMKNAVLAAACERVFNLPASFYRQYESAELSDRVLKIDQVFTLLSSVGIKTFIGAVFSLMYLFQMNKYAPDLMKFAIIMVIIVMAVIIFLAVRQTKYEKDLLEESAEATSRMYQFLSGIQKIRASGVEDRVLYEYLQPYGKTRSVTMRKERMTNTVDVIAFCMINVFTVILYYQMVKNVMPLSIGQFTAFMTAFGAFAGAVIEAGKSLLDLNSVLPMLERLKPVLEARPEYGEDMELPGNLTGDIEISNVDFAYDEESGLVLRDLSLHIKEGEYIGIVGSSGCGKSTLLKLLLGFEKPTSGKIYYDSKDIDRMDKRELRKKFGVVLQDGRLIAGSIFDNIVISAPNATIKDAERAAEAVGLAADIAAMPMGMHTVLSETGGTISGGQAQRILIARAIIGNPKILFFDEATSALDNVTQSMVTESLNKLNATRLVIAHRLSTIVDCDRILVMDKGRVVEEGNFEELMKMKGLFYDLASRQMA